MNCTKRSTILAILLVVGLIFAGLFMALKKPDSGNSSANRLKVGALNAPNTNPFHSGRTGPALPSDPATKPDVAKRLQTALSALKAGNSAASGEILADLRAYLVSLPPDLATAEITDFLTDPAADCPTQIEFVIGSNGSLSGQSSLRVALLDWLGEIDPQQAGVVAKRVLSTPTAADEWAVCLRNYARAYPNSESNSFLRTKTEELIANPAWQADPSIGYLNSFDVLVHTNATASTPLLSSLIQRKDRKDLAHAGFLTLDRLVQRNPSDVLTRLSTDTALTQSRPEMVGNIFARADLRDPVQREIVKNWLLDPARTGAELQSFTAVYPNANRFISNNLLTKEPQQSGADLAEHDRQALEILKSWSEDPAFRPLETHLRTMTARLNGFVGAQRAPTTPVPAE